MNDLICAGFWLVVSLAAWAVYRRSFARGYWDLEHPPLYFDLADPEDEHEVKCIQEQRRSGRERGGEINIIKKEDYNE